MSTRICLVSRNISIDHSVLGGNTLAIGLARGYLQSRLGVGLSHRSAHTGTRSVGKVSIRNTRLLAGSILNDVVKGFRPAITSDANNVSGALFSRTFMSTPNASAGKQAANSNKTTDGPIDSSSNLSQGTQPDSSVQQAPADFTKSEKAIQAAQVNLAARLPQHANGASGSGSRKEIFRLFSLVRGEKKNLAAAMALLLLSSGVTLTLPWVIGKILDAVNNATPTEPPLVFGLPLSHFFIGLGSVFLVGSAAVFGRTVLLRTIGERVVSKLRLAIFKKTISQDAEFFDANRVGDLISRLTTDANVVSKSVTQNIADGLRSTLSAIMGVGMMSYISLELTSTIMLVLPPVLAGTWLYGRKVRQISRNFQVALGSLTKVSEERFSNVRTAQSFVGESQEVRLYADRVREVFGIAKQEAVANGTFFSIVQLTGNFALMGLLAIGANMVTSGSLTFGQLTSYIMYTAYAGSAVSGIGNFYSELMKGSGAASRLFEIMDRNPSIHPSKGEKLENPRGIIKFENVKFAYPTRPAVNIFQNLTFTIPPGSNVCIVGPSGGGKSTISSLLLRFYDPLEGSISIGKQKLKDVSVKSLRRNVGVVSQEPVLFSGTIAENIAYSVPGATREQIFEAAKKANCSFISDFPDGLDTLVGARGAQLSGGQKQRIAIARALIKSPSILILDEATSALDAESESSVNKALVNLMKEKSTTISIAHRLSTISRSDQVIVLGQGGYVAEQGKFKELYADPHSALSQLLQARSDILPDNVSHSFTETPERLEETEADKEEAMVEIDQELKREMEEEDDDRNLNYIK
ncbi:ATP-binding cassette permease MDL2 [Sugiyamaella lignohabitans]|uniref:ATP-binding cassette permease MDL2 n=1 Tax=Sugiyamaella lignohabitans TaxID=796027 RepID=A0A167FDS2_9ASCO|nr:ATP-binding cassette permease MDL2 [Sugiyamaella lignohabitans]ANB15171.1 ATP-binding cassette permease MDL2 [Sugiyamaella lignohabitans]